MALINEACQQRNFDFLHLTNHKNIDYSSWLKYQSQYPYFMLEQQIIATL